MLDGVRQFAQSLADAGVPHPLRVWKRQVHVFPFFAAFIPEGERALQEAEAFLRLRDKARGHEVD